MGPQGAAREPSEDLKVKTNSDQVFEMAFPEISGRQNQYLCYFTVNTRGTLRNKINSQLQ